jgi:hypothetical protein
MPHPSTSSPPLEARSAAFAEALSDVSSDEVGCGAALGELTVGVGYVGAVTLTGKIDIRFPSLERGELVWQISSTPITRRDQRIELVFQLSTANFDRKTSLRRVAAESVMLRSHSLDISSLTALFFCDKQARIYPRDL